MKNYMTVIYTILTTFSLQAQSNWLQYDAIWMKYSEYNLQGIQQRLSFNHKMTMRFGLSGTVFLGSGRGKDISNEFGKDYILLSKDNWQHVPISLTNGLTLYYDGISNLKRISSGLLTESGYAVGMFYHPIFNKKMTSKIGISYASSYQTINVRDQLFEINITHTDPLFIDQNYSIRYPAPILRNNRYDFAVLQADVGYEISSKIKIGLSSLVQWRFDLSYFDYGGGAHLQLKL